MMTPRNKPLTRPSVATITTTTHQIAIVAIMFAFAFTTFAAPDTPRTDTAKTDTSRFEDKPGFWDRVGGACVSAWETVSQPLDYLLPHYEKRKIIHEEETRYFRVTVEDDAADSRHLVFNPRKGSQSIIRVTNPDEIVSEFSQYMLMAPLMLERPIKRVLFIGLGGGVMPMYIQKMYPSCQIDVVEIDDGVPPIAEKYFRFKPGKNLKVIIGDGRVYVNRCQNGVYDIVFIDAYNHEERPFQLTTQAFYRRVKAILKPDGVVTVNLAPGGESKFCANELKTIQNVFPNMAVYECLFHYIPFASSQTAFKPKPLLEAAEAADKSKRFPFAFVPLLKNRVNPKALQVIYRDADAYVLTDDYAPVNLNR